MEESRWMPTISPVIGVMKSAAQEEASRMGQSEYPLQKKKMSAIKTTDRNDQPDKIQP